MHIAPLELHPLARLVQGRYHKRHCCACYVGEIMSAGRVLALFLKMLGRGVWLCWRETVRFFRVLRSVTRAQLLSMCAGWNASLVGIPCLNFRPELRREYPLNLSISVSGGKETNEDSRSNGE